MSPGRMLLHVVTATTCVVGVAVAVWPPAPRPAARSAGLVAAVPPPSTTMRVESFAPAAAPDRFEVQPLPRAATAPTAPVVATEPTATVTSSVPAPRAVPAGVAAADAATNTQLVARLTRTTAVYARPGDARAVMSLAATTELGNARVLPVTQLGGDWLRVQLPTRPNGSSGWIRARDASVDSVVDRVVVDLGARTLTWMHAGSVQLSVSVAIGAAASPTPVGDFFVTDVLPARQGSAYGAWVIALDGHSDAFTEFEGGDARIAIHGTDDPSSIGRAASFGCVRVDDVTLARLASALGAGTPVAIR